jgi:hypothetical protein
MSERNINIDDLFKDALKDFKVESPLRSKTVKKESFLKKNAVGLALGVVGLSAVASLLFFFTQEKEQPTKEALKPQMTPVVAKTPEKEIIRDTVVKVVEVPKTIVVETPAVKSKSEPKVEIPVYKESAGEKSMIITTRSSYSETYEVDENGNKIKVLSTQKTQRSDTTLLK